VPIGPVLLGIPDSENTIYVPKDTPEDVIKTLDEALAAAGRYHLHSL
jgi:hypothetical protein